MLQFDKNVMHSQKENLHMNAKISYESKHPVCVGYLPALLKLLEASYSGLMQFELSLIT